MDTDQGFDWASIGWYVLLVFHAMRRHKLVLFLVWFGVIGLSVALMAVLPKTYEVRTTLQAQRTQVIGAISSGNAPQGTDVPTKQAAETVLSHDNLTSLVRQTDLLRTWSLRRAPLMKVKDFIFEHLFETATDEARTEGFVNLLEKQLSVTTGEGTVTIGVQFPDPQLAFQLVETAVENFLEARHAAEISSIADVISILDTRATQAREQLDEALRQLQDLRNARSARLGLKSQRPGSPPKATPRLAPPPDKETTQLMLQVESKRRAIADLEDFRKKRVTELETKLIEQKALYSESHPVVADTQQSLRALRQESPQVAVLRRELAPLEAELVRRGASPDGKAKPAPRSQDIGVQLAVLEQDDPGEDQDPDIDYAKNNVRHALSRYDSMLDRVAAARLEQDAAQAAFKYRYTVIWPAQKPRGAIRPKPALIVSASMVAGLLLGIIAAALVDISSRKVVEPWQVERGIGVPLLGETRQMPSVWPLLMVRRWNTMALVSPDNPQQAWALAQKLVELAGEDALKAVNVLELNQQRANAIAHAISPSKVAASGRRFVIAVASPAENPLTGGVLASCDAVLLVLESGKSRIPEARRTVELVGRERLLGAVLHTG